MAIKIVKIISRNGIGIKFMNDYTICFVELEFLPDNVVIEHFQKMENRNWEMLMRGKYH